MILEHFIRQWKGYSWASERAEQNKWHWTSVSLYGLYLALEQQSLNRASHTVITLWRYFFALVSFEYKKYCSTQKQRFKLLFLDVVLGFFFLEGNNVYIRRHILKSEMHTFVVRFDSFFPQQGKIYFVAYLEFC